MRPSTLEEGYRKAKDDLARGQDAILEWSFLHAWWAGEKARLEASLKRWQDHAWEMQSRIYSAIQPSESQLVDLKESLRMAATTADAHYEKIAEATAWVVACRNVAELLERGRAAPLALISGGKSSVKGGT